MKRERVLLAITVYNGWSFVPRALRSAMNLDRTDVDIDVLVLDDCSPEAGFSPKLAELSGELGVQYYRSPRNLGIVRNVNLGLLAAIDGGYDAVVVSNSDVVYSRGAIGELWRVSKTDERIGSVTAWSNNASIYALENTDPDRFISSQHETDWVADVLAPQFRGMSVDVPAGISFCMLIPCGALTTVGLMDPVYGRGYCEETDWSLRSLEFGHRVVVAPAAFVYHQGRGSTLPAGLVRVGQTTVPDNERIVDFRYPRFRAQVDAFLRGGVIRRLRANAAEQLIAAAAAQFGWSVVDDGAPAEAIEHVQVSYAQGAALPRIRAGYRGFECTISSRGERPAAAVEAFFQRVRPAPVPMGASAAARLSYPSFI